jgi:hypothetical protein
MVVFVTRKVFGEGGARMGRCGCGIRGLKR